MPHLKWVILWVIELIQSSTYTTDIPPIKKKVKQYFLKQKVSFENI